MDWKTRFPVGLALLAALILAGGVSAATSMKLVSAHNMATRMASHDESQDPAESDDPGDSEPPEESERPDESPPDQSYPTESDARGIQAVRWSGSTRAATSPLDTPALEGNWTHGQYVSAFATADDREAHLAAARSDCGKPMKPSGHAKKERQEPQVLTNSAYLLSNSQLISPEGDPARISLRRRGRSSPVHPRTRCQDVPPGSG